MVRSTWFAMTTSQHLLLHVSCERAELQQARSPRGGYRAGADGASAPSVSPRLLHPTEGLRIVSDLDHDRELSDEWAVANPRALVLAISPPDSPSNRESVEALRELDELKDEVARLRARIQQARPEDADVRPERHRTGPPYGPGSVAD